MISNLLRAVTIIIVTALGLSCCRKSHDGNIQVNVFPVESSLKCATGEVLEIPSIGIMEMNVANGQLVVSTSAPSDLWQIYSLPEVDSIGNMFRIGAGPGELDMPTPSILASFYKSKDDNHVMCLVPNVMSGKFTAGDLTEFTSRDTVINNRIGPTTMMAYRLDDSRWLNVEIVPDSCKIRRSIIGNDGKVMANQAVDSLNQATVKDMSQMPLIMFRPVISRDGVWIAEVSGFKPEINVWNSHTGESFQIIYPDIDNGNIVARMGEDRPLFQGGVAFDDFFAVQRNNEDGGINIDFFKWDGNPVATLNLDCNTIRRFDIDIKNGDLYCLDGNQDAIVKFPIGEFLSKLKE